jgi:hypothetical protein
VIVELLVVAGELGDLSGDLLPNRSLMKGFMMDGRRYRCLDLLEHLRTLPFARQRAVLVLCY